MKKNDDKNVIILRKSEDWEEENMIKIRIQKYI